ncbi:MAG: META domain-containing protein [Actinomycetota bacterium]
MRLRPLLPVLALALILGACAEEEVLVNPPAAAWLEGTRWVVIGFTLDGTGGLLPTGIRLTLDFDDAGGVGGTAGCNSYFGTVTSTAGGITITGIGSTEMACEPGIMERETRFLTALGRATAFALDEDHLSLTAGDGAVSIDLAPFVPEADRPLAGTTWQLITLIDGDSASSIIAGTTPMLEVDDLAGRISGNTGCNSFFGPVTFEDQTVSVGALAATPMACEPGVMAQESFVFEVLGAAATWEIDGTTLRIAAADGRALEFSAG